MLNYENEGTRICRIADSKKHINKTISVYGDDDEGFKELTLPDNDASHFQIVPTNKERTVQFVCGSSGSGKSYFTAQYVKEYRKMFPDRQVYLFSAMPKDDNFDKLGYVKRIKMDDTLITDPLYVGDFEKSLVVFDDCDTLKKLMRDALYILRDKILELGRHLSIDCVFLSHLCSGLELRRVLNESMIITMFPANFNRQYKYLLENYLGLEKKQIQRVKKSRSRAVSFVRSFPNVVIEHKNIRIATNDLD